MKALELLKTNRTVAERSEGYVKAIKRDIQKEQIDVLIEKTEKIQDEITELTDFTLESDANRGLSSMTKEQCKNRFKRIIQLEFELTLNEIELSCKQKSFNTYFGDGTAV